MNHKVLYRVALFCLFSMLSAVLMHAGEQQQQSKGIVTGRIVDQQKQPYYPVAVPLKVFILADIPTRMEFIISMMCRRAVRR